MDLRTPQRPIARLVLSLGAFAILSAAATAAGAAPPQPAEGIYEVQVNGLHCQACVDKATKALENVQGVESATILLETGAGRIQVTSDGADPEAMRAAIAKVDLELVFAGDAVIAPLTDEERAGLDIRTATVGDAIDLRDHLVEGKYTIFDFTAEWCAPCRVLTPKLENMVKMRPDEIALRFVDIVDWKSEMAQLATKDYKLKGLPYVRVYAPGGTFLGAVVGLQPELVGALIASGEKGVAVPKEAKP